MSYPQYPMQPQYQPQVPAPFQQRRKLDFVDGEAGIPSEVHYNLTEEGQSIAGRDIESRLAAMEQSINEIKEALNAHAVPDVRAGGQPRHVSGAAGQAGSGTDWQSGSSATAADFKQS